MRTHFKVVAILNIIMGARALGGIAVLLSGTLGSLWVLISAETARSFNPAVV